MILTIFDPQVDPIYPFTFCVNWPFGLREEEQNIFFQNGGHGSHLGFPVETILAYFNYKLY